MIAEDKALALDNLLNLKRRPRYGTPLKDHTEPLTGILPGHATETI